MPAYELRFDPPAPVAIVTILNLVSGNILSEIPMLLDSGADVTLLPQFIVEKLALQVDHTIEINLIGFDGATSRSGVVDIHLTFQSITFRGKYPLTNAPIGIIGRDILNFLTLTLRGKTLVWEISKE